MKEKAYITLLDNDDYIYSVIACYSSWLKTKSSYSFYCACTKNVPTNILKNLQELDIPVIKLPELAGLDLLKAKLKSSGYNSWIPALAKLAIYGLDEFEKLIFLDADTYIYKNLDHLFDKPHLTGVPDGAGRNTGNDKFVKGDNYFNKFNAGMVVIEPSKELLKKIINSTKQLTVDRPWADQNIVSELYPNWVNEPEKQLPIYYNCFGRHICEYEQNIKDFSTDKIYVLHLVGRKLSPNYAFESIINSSDGNKHNTYYKLIHNICKAVNTFILDKQADNKLLNLKLVKLPWQYSLVVPYVDSTEPSWVKAFNKYNPSSQTTEEVNAINRFRGQGNFFRYFFRCVEKNMPWVNKIFLLVASKAQVPNWLDRSKVTIVTHDQFIPKEYLPTFNSCTIEMFLWKIPGLTERFIYANDDFFAVNKLTISNLFDQDKILINSSVKTNNKTMYDHHCINCYNLIFGKLNNEKYLTFEHCFRPYFKSEMKQCFEMYKDQILNSITRFRSHKNYNCYLYLEDLVAKHKYDKAKLHILYCDSRNSTQNLHKMPNIDIACINDGQEINIYDDEILNTYFMHKFPNRSMFELTDYVYEKPVDINKYLQQPKKETKKDTRADGQSGAFLYF